MKAIVKLLGTVLGFFIIGFPVMLVVFVLQHASYWLAVGALTLLLAFMPAPQSWTDANNRATEARKARDERR